MHICNIEAKLNCRIIQHWLNDEDIQPEDDKNLLVNDLYRMNFVNTGALGVFLKKNWQIKEKVLR